MVIGVLRAWIEYCDLHAYRDKLYRAAQFGSRCLSWFLERSGARKEQVQLCQEVAKLLSNSRKLFHLGKWTESLLELYGIVNKNADPVWKTVNSLFQMSSGAFYFYDMCQWLHFTKLMRFTNKTLLDDKRNGAWLLRIILGTCVLYFKYEDNAKELEKIDQSADFGITEEENDNVNKDACLTKKRNELLGKRQLFFHDLLRNIADFPCALSALSLVNLHDGYIGMFGLFSSLLGAYDKWPT